MSIETAYTVPTMTEALRARLVLRQYLAETPLVASRDLSIAIEAGDVFVKCENLQPTGAFKLRGGVYLMSQLSPPERSRGVVVASTGNHGQSIAYASRLFAAPCTVFAPESAERIKVQRMQQLGAAPSSASWACNRRAPPRCMNHGGPVRSWSCRAKARSRRDSIHVSPSSCRWPS